MLQDLGQVNTTGGAVIMSAFTIIDASKALALWDQACATTIGNILMDNGKLAALSGKARDTFISKMDMDPDTWLRARTLGKATFELCQITDKRSHEAGDQKRIIGEVIQKC